MPGKIRTTGELREFLVGMMIGVKNGDVKVDEAARITKLAAQIHESFYSEIKIAKVQIESGQSAASLGNLPINQE
jgi:hypothetical protein